MKWDYPVTEAKLDQIAPSDMGQQGWALVAVMAPGHFVLHCFVKRALTA